MAPVKKRKAPATLWPPRRDTALREWLQARYPDRDKNLLGVAAIQIDELIRDMRRAERVVKVKRGQFAVGKGGSVVDALRRIQGTIATGKTHLYAKAIAEAPVDALALVDQVRDDITTRHTITGATGFPIPAPAEIAPYVSAAIAIASRPGASRWRRDRTVGEIRIWFERITGEKARQSSKRGPFIVFLNDLELFYSPPPKKGETPEEAEERRRLGLRFGVQKSTRALSKILGSRS